MRFPTPARLASIALATATLVAVPAAQAITVSTPLVVTATVLSTCVVAATPLLFTGYTLAVLDNTATITVTCTPDVSSYTVGLGPGNGTGATTSTRQLKSVAGNTLNYFLYRNAARDQNWGNIPADSQPSSLATSTVLLTKTFTVYGRLPAGQYASGDATGLAYVDTVQVDVNY